MKKRKTSRKSVLIQFKAVRHKIKMALRHIIFYGKNQIIPIKLFSSFYTCLPDDYKFLNILFINNRMSKKEVKKESCFTITGRKGLEC